jgi:hypothetical protein
MRSALAAPLAFAVIVCSLLAYAEMMPQKAPFDATAVYEERVEEGFGRLDVVPSNWPGLPRERAAQLSNTSRILAASPE